MIQITKIFRFEMAHAIYGYAGKCKNIHGHSYVLHVTVAGNTEDNHFISAPGFIIDFKQLKKIINETVIHKLDHQLVLSNKYVQSNELLKLQENIFLWEMEPSAENMLIYIKQNLESVFPPEIRLIKLKLFETADSYAEWVA
jgi:6-pyruvoyltetrahydropterin/6-carboxytetrahydropterin synthase